MLVPARPACPQAAHPDLSSQPALHLPALCPQVFLKFGDRRRIASELKIGDIVERHLDREWHLFSHRAGHGWLE